MKNPSGSNPKVRIPSQSGVSLVELMVAMVIALLLATAIGGLFVSSKGSFRLQSGTSAARESGLAVIEDLSREIRRAGNYGCFVPRDTKDGGAAFLTTARLPMALSNRFPIPTVGAAPNLVPRVGPNFAVFSDAASTLPVSGSYTVVPGSDYLEFNFGDPVTFLNADMNSGTDPLQLGQPVFLASGQPLLLSTCTRMTLLRADNGGLTGALVSTVSHDPALGDNTAQASEVMYHRFSRGSTVMKLAASRLFVATTSSDGSTNLYRHDTIASNGGTPQPFASNVMDMRVRLALDNGAGGVTWSTGAAVTAASKWPEVLGAQVHFVVASSESVPGPIYDLVWDNTNGFVQGSTVVADGKPRRAFVVTSSIRGRNEIVGR